MKKTPHLVKRKWFLPLHGLLRPLVYTLCWFNARMKRPCVISLNLQLHDELDEGTTKVPLHYERPGFAGVSAPIVSLFVNGLILA